MEDSPLNANRPSVTQLLNLIAKLRGTNGCPWDKQQTPQSIMPFLIEEAYELANAVAAGDADEICEELGDVLFQVLFLIRLCQEADLFDFTEVVARNLKKMIRRHPHVFGAETAATSQEVKARWHQIKMTEKGRTLEDSILDSVPSSMPALMRAYRISARAARVGFDWDDVAGVTAKVEEEWCEFNDAVSDTRSEKRNRSSVTLEFGDILFTLVNVARFVQVHPETALIGSIDKFEKRFRYMEKAINSQGKTMASMSKTELNDLWEVAKSKADSATIIE